MQNYNCFESIKMNLPSVDAHHRSNWVADEKLFHQVMTSLTRATQDNAFVGFRHVGNREIECVQFYGW